MIQGAEGDGEVQEGAEEVVEGTQGVEEEVVEEIQGVEEVPWQWAELQQDQEQVVAEEVKAEAGVREEERAQEIWTTTAATTLSPRVLAKLSRQSVNNYKT